MPPDALLDQDDDYVSSEDSDFAPDDAAAPDRASTPSEDEADDVAAGPAEATTTRPTTTSKRKRPQAGETEEAEDAGFENSGDEAIIGRGKKRLKRAGRRDEEDDEGGEGGLIKTRSQRALEKVEKRVAVDKGPVTIDVDKLWEEMVREDVPAGTTTTTTRKEDAGDKSGDTVVREGASQQAGQEAGKEAAETMIRIKRTYNFAGKVHTEEKLVARDSAEAKLYLASLDPTAAPPQDSDEPPKRMPRKAFRSVFEPVVSDSGALQQRSDLNLGMGVRLKAREAASRAEAKKLNTVEKSRMDWAGYVDQEGIKDELELAGKSKTSFVGRQDFLARSEARREEEARRARLAGKV